MSIPWKLGKCALMVGLIILIAMALGCSSEQEETVASFHEKKIEILSLINQRRFDLAEKEMERYDIPPLANELSELRLFLKQTKTADTFNFNQKKILSNLQALIDQKKFDLAENEIQKYDIPKLAKQLTHMKESLSKAKEDAKKRGEESIASRKKGGTRSRITETGSRKGPSKKQQSSPDLRPTREMVREAKYYFK